MLALIQLSAVNNFGTPFESARFLKTPNQIKQIKVFAMGMARVEGRVEGVGVIFYDLYFRTDPGVSGSTWRLWWSRNQNLRRIG